jgi:hypothetical protein
VTQARADARVWTLGCGRAVLSLGRGKLVHGEEINEGCARRLCIEEARETKLGRGVPVRGSATCSHVHCRSRGGGLSGSPR